jgi:methyltransferase (TIGR00027 family)
MTGSDAPLRNVSDTAHWVALFRAIESERPDAHFRDPYARRLAGERGEQVLRHMGSSAGGSWPMVVRTAVMDELLLRLVRDEGAELVANLAAGLDARPWRMDLPPSLRWIEVDLPEITEYKRRALAGETPRCVLESVAADLSDPAQRRAVLSRIAGLTSRGVVLTEGLLVYLAPEQVGDLARELADCGAFRWWITDIASPRILAMLRKRWGSRLTAGNAPMRFGPAEGTAFFLPHGWKEAEFRSTWEEAKRLKRMPPGSWLWKLMERLQPPSRREVNRRLAGIVLLERA